MSGCLFGVSGDIYRMLPHEKVELEKKFADWADTNPELIPKAPGTGLPMDDKNPNGHKVLLKV